MPKFEIQQVELHVMKYRVEADSEAVPVHPAVALLPGRAAAVSQKDVAGGAEDNAIGLRR